MSQKCKMVLGLPSHLQGLVQLRASNLTFSGSRDMMQFRVVQWTMADTQDGVEVTAEKRKGNLIIYYK